MNERRAPVMAAGQPANDYQMCPLCAKAGETVKVGDDGEWRHSACSLCDDDGWLRCTCVLEGIIARFVSRITLPQDQLTERFQGDAQLFCGLPGYQFSHHGVGCGKGRNDTLRANQRLFYQRAG